MRTNNKWNRFFHKSEIKKNQELCAKYNKQCLKAQNILDAIENCDSLLCLMNIHKDAWGTGFQNLNLDACPYGFFRTTDISEMTPNQVYLGGIYGLSTNSIPFWESHKDERYGANGFGIDSSLYVYDIILNQYKRHLKSNIVNMYAKAKVELQIYKKYGY